MKSNGPGLHLVQGGPYQKTPSLFPLLFRHPRHPAAVRLREKYRLLEVAGDGTDFERARRLMNWVRGRWDHGWDQQNEKSALEILAAAAKGKHFPCAHYSRTLVECCLAIGLPAREMTVLRKGADFPDRMTDNAGHSVSEVYCRQWRKWVMLDADANAFYTQGGVPIGCLELHRAWHADRGRSVEQVHDQPSFVTPAACAFTSAAELRRIWREFTRHQTKDYYHQVAALWPESVMQPLKNESMHFVWFNGLVPPLLAFLYQGLDLDRHHCVTEERDFNWPIDETYVRARMDGGRECGRLELHLDHAMPFFEHFQVRVGNEPYTRIEGHRQVIECAPGVTRIHACAVDCFGLPGHEASLVVKFEPGPARPTPVRRKGSAS